MQKKKYSNNISAKFSEVVICGSKLSFTLVIIENKSLTAWSDKYLAVYQIFLIFLKKFS